MAEKIYVYCKHCNDSVDYVVKEMKKEGRVKGKMYEYIGKEAFCVKCNFPVLVGDIHNENMEKLYEKYRKEQEEKEN